MTVHIPSWTGEQALVVANLLEEILADIWSLHGHAIADQIERLDGQRAISWKTRERALRRKAGTDDDIPF